MYIVPLDNIHWHRYVCWFFIILYLSVVDFMQWSIIDCIGYFIGLFFMCTGVVGCVGCGGVSGCIRVSLFVILCSLMTYALFSVRGG